MTLRPRTRAMVDRVTAETRAVLDHDGTAQVRAAVLAALKPRDERYDDHDPRCLAPARVVRILIADAACRDPDALAAAPFVDSVDRGHDVETAMLTARARTILQDVPLPAGADDERLLERIIIADPAAAAIAIAERLDQARHLHLRPELPWEPVHASVRRAYIPAARRIAPRLEQRLARWADAFERRLLLRRPRSCDA